MALNNVVPGADCGKIRSRNARAGNRPRRAYAVDKVEGLRFAIARSARSVAACLPNSTSRIFGVQF